MKGHGWRFEKEVEKEKKKKTAPGALETLQIGTGEALWRSSCRNRHPNAIYIQLSLYIQKKI